MLCCSTYVHVFPGHHGSLCSPCLSRRGSQAFAACGALRPPLIICCNSILKVPSPYAASDKHRHHGHDETKLFTGQFQQSLHDVFCILSPPELQVNNRTPMFNGQPSLPCPNILLDVNTINVMPASFRCNRIIMSHVF